MTLPGRIIEKLVEDSQLDASPDYLARFIKSPVTADLLTGCTLVCKKESDVYMLKQQGTRNIPGSIWALSGSGHLMCSFVPGYESIEAAFRKCAKEFSERVSPVKEWCKSKQAKQTAEMYGASLTTNFGGSPILITKSSAGSQQYHVYEENEILKFSPFSQHQEPKFDRKVMQSLKALRVRHPELRGEPEVQPYDPFDL